MSIFLERLDKIKNNLTEIVHSYKEEKNINLYMSYYHDNNDDRRKELQLAIKLNSENRLFKKFVVVSEVETPLDFIEESERIIIIHKKDRCTFNDFFRVSNEQISGDTDTINILINTDIVIGENFDKISLEEKQALCLTRYEIMEEENTYKIEVGAGSCDTWVWKGYIPDIKEDFFMGKYFCDGRIAFELKSNNYTLKNPSLDLKTYHLHISNVRNYDYTQSFDRIAGNRIGAKITNNDNIFLIDDMYNDGYFPY
jgi:hypothetical protein